MPYTCNQTITGNHETRHGAWEVYDNWERLQKLGLGTKPSDHVEWMQRKPIWLDVDLGRFLRKSKRVLENKQQANEGCCPRNSNRNPDSWMQ